MKVSINIRSDSTMVAYIGGKRYEYLLNDLGRAKYLEGKYKHQPGKLFNELKKESIQTKDIRGGELDKSTEDSSRQLELDFV